MRLAFPVLGSLSLKADRDHNVGLFSDDENLGIAKLLVRLGERYLDRGRTLQGIMTLRRAEEIVLAVARRTAHLAEARCSASFLRRN